MTDRVEQPVAPPDAVSDDDGTKAAESAQQADTNLADALSPETQRLRKSRRPGSFGDVGRTIRSRTTDLLAIGVIAVGGVAVGSRVSSWWTKDDPAKQSPAEIAAETVGRPVFRFGTSQAVSLDFGNAPWSLQRSLISGNRQEAAAALLSALRVQAERVPAPSGSPSPAEQKLLASLAGKKPAEITAGGCRLYRVDGPVTMMSVTRPVAVSSAGKLSAEKTSAEKSSAEKTATQGSAKETNASHTSERLLCWGLLFPAGEKRWVHYLFVPLQARLSGPEKEIHPPLPSQARPLLTMRTAGGTLMKTFQLDPTVAGLSAAEVRRFYTGWFERRGWKQQQSSAGGEAVSFRKKTESGIWRAELYLGRRSDGLLLGTLWIERLPP